MLDLLLDGLIDSCKLLPVLFLSYFCLEYLRQKKEAVFFAHVIDAKYRGPIDGALLGCIPQCGFSAIMSDLYAKGYITVGTLIAVFLATSDEAVPILLSYPNELPTLFSLLGIKLVAGICFGLIIDSIYTKKQLGRTNTSHSIEQVAVPSCCSHNVLKGALAHTFTIFLYLLGANLLLNLVIHFTSEDFLASLLMMDTPFQPLIAGVVGLIPNCIASVMLVELYLGGSLNFGSLVTGLCAGAGVGLLVLFRNHKRPLHNLGIISAVYGLSLITGWISSLLPI